MRRCESNASSAVQSEEEQGSRSSPVMTGIFTFIHLYAKHWSIEACRSRFDSSYSRYHCCYVCHKGHIWWARLWLLDESTNIVIIKCVKCCFVLYCWIRTTRFLKHSSVHRTCQQLLIYICSSLMRGLSGTECLSYSGTSDDMKSLGWRNLWRLPLYHHRKTFSFTQMLSNQM